MLWANTHDACLTPVIYSLQILKNIAESAAAHQRVRLSFSSVFMQVPSKLRLAALLGILRSSCRPGQPGKEVVFMSSCDSVEFHYILLSTQADELVEDGQLLLACPVFMLHGNMPQVMPPGCNCSCVVALVCCKATASTCKDMVQHSKLPKVMPLGCCCCMFLWSKQPHLRSLLWLA